MRGIMVIAAISTAVQTGGIAVIRLSGEQSLDVAARLFTAKKLKDGFKPDPGYMYLGTIDAGGFCDKCYMVYFRGPASFTGEDVVEFHLHGGVRLAQGVLDACCAAGARPAERGEFTKRAFLNGKLALADAEGVIDMINADSRAALSAAYRLMEGELSAKVRIIQDLLFDTVTGLEATLDYPDEMEDEQLPSAYGRILQALEMLEPLIKGQSYGQMAKYGINAVLTGRTNVGKSSLMNKMLGSQRAIVTEKAGTTRDVITESLEHNGVKINLADTAGIRESADEIEQEGVKRAKNALSSADLVIFVQAADDMGDSPVEQCAGKRIIKVINKTDLVKGIKPGRKEKEECFDAVFGVSALTGEGVEEVLDYVAGLFTQGEGSGEIVTNVRHADAIRKAHERLKEARDGFASAPTDCVLVDVRAAWTCLGEITGNTASEDIVNAIFQRFCVGK